MSAVDSQTTLVKR